MVSMTSVEEKVDIEGISTSSSAHDGVPDFVDVPHDTSLGTQVVLSPLSPTCSPIQHSQLTPNEVDPPLPATPSNEDSEQVVRPLSSPPPIVKSQINIRLRTPTSENSNWRRHKIFLVPHQKYSVCLWLAGHYADRSSLPCVVIPTSAMGDVPANKSPHQTSQHHQSTPNFLSLDSG